MTEYLSLADLAREVGVSLPTIRRWIADPEHPLPSHQICRQGNDRGRVLVLRSEFDAWVKAFPAATQRVANRPASSAMADRVAAAMRRMQALT